MSSMLEQAIIDAKMLKETARKNAEADILEQYAPEIKRAMDMLLEQDDASGMDAGGDSAMAAPIMPSMDDALGGAEATPETKKVVDRIPASYLGEDNMQEVEINLDSIVEKIDEMQKDLNVSIPDMNTPAHEVIPHANITNMPTDTLAENVEEVDEEQVEEACAEEGQNLEEELEEEYQLDEELVMDIGNVSAGGIHANEIELKRQHDISKALAAQNDHLKEELKVREEQLASLEERLEGIFSTLKETKSKLKKSVDINVQLKEGFQFLTKKIADVNLLNARLLYTNKTLGNVSLNERQKKQIAESISNSKSVEEAKTIYETLQKSVQVANEKRATPQSLTEAISRAPSAFLPRNNNASVSDPNIDRWQRIAGIKK